MAQKLRGVFARLDTKGDGKLDQEELGAYLKAMDYTPKKAGQSDRRLVRTHETVRWTPRRQLTVLPLAPPRRARWPP